MQQAALRPYATAGVALVGASLIAVTPALAPPLPLADTQMRDYQLTASADAFEDLASYLDANASTDGFLSFAAQLDDYLDQFGNPTVNVADTLSTDLIGLLSIGSSLTDITGLLGGLTGLGTGVGDITTAISTLDTDVTGAISTLDSDLATDLGDITKALGAGGTLDTDLSTIATDLSPLTTIATDLGSSGVLATDLSGISDTLASILAALL